MAIEAVTFDFWNTLVHEVADKRDDRTHAWSQLLLNAGYDVDDARLRAAVEAGWHAYVIRWTDNVPFGAAEVIEVVLDVLGIASTSELSGAMLEVVIDPPVDAYPPLNPNVGVTLEALRNAGVKIGIICDVGLTPSPILRRHLQVQGVLDYFDHWAFSDEVGVYKPDAKIFRYALDGLGGVAPEHAAHVGDLRRTDIVGAKAMGMTAVRYRGISDDPVMPDSPMVEGDHVLDDHADLPGALGII